MSSMARNKGKNGELEMIKLIFNTTGIQMRRNLEQYQSGGCDLLGVPGTSWEIKRCEKLALPAWWRQTIAQAARNNDIPILAYRQNRKPWNFIVGAEKDEMSKDQFIAWIKSFVSNIEVGA